MSAPAWTPPPASQIPTSVPRAPTAAAVAPLAPSGVGRRIAAYLVDLALVAVLAVGGWLLTGSVILAVVLAVEVLVALAVIEARSGRTVGKVALGLRAAQADAPLAPGLKRESIRASLFGASHLALGLGQFALLASAKSDATERGQGWHDRVAGTRVVDIRPGRPAPAAKKVRTAAAPATPQPARYQASAPYQPAAYQGPSVGQIPGRPQAPGYVPPQGGFGIPTAPGWVPQAGAGTGSGAQLSGDSISMNEFRRLQQTGSLPVTRPGMVPPRPTSPSSPSGQVSGQGQAAPQRSVVPPRPGQQQPAPQQPVPQQPVQAQRPATQPTAAQRPVQQRVSQSAAQQHPAPASGQPAAQVSNQASGAVVPPRPGASTPGAAKQMVLAVRGGASYTVPAEAVVGRRPQASDPSAQLIAIESASRALSRTHARIRLISGTVWVEDVGSANGSRLHTPDGAITKLMAGTPLAAPVGSVLELGEVRIDIAVR